MRNPNEDWGCALYKGAHYTPKNTVDCLSNTSFELHVVLGYNYNMYIHVHVYMYVQSCTLHDCVALATTHEKEVRNLKHKRQGEAAATCKYVCAGGGEAFRQSQDIGLTITTPNGLSESPHLYRVRGMRQSTKPLAFRSTLASVGTLMSNYFSRYEKQRLLDCLTVMDAQVLDPLYIRCVYQLIHFLCCNATNGTIKY